MPPVVVGERGCRLTRRVCGETATAEEDQVPLAIRPQLAQIDILALILAVEALLRIAAVGILVRARNGARRRRDLEAFSVGDARIPAGGYDFCRRGDIQGQIEVEPGRLCIGHLDPPRDLHAALAGDLSDHFAGAVETINAKARGLPLYFALGVPEIAGIAGVRPGYLGAEEVFVGAISDASNSNGREDFKRNDICVAHR